MLGRLGKPMDGEDKHFAERYQNSAMDLIVPTYLPTYINITSVSKWQQRTWQRLGTPSSTKQQEHGNPKPSSGGQTTLSNTLLSFRSR